MIAEDASKMDGGPADTNTSTFQCVVCQTSCPTLNDLHRHQSYRHTGEELSLSVIGLQSENIRMFEASDGIVYDNSWLCDPRRHKEFYAYSANMLSDANNNNSAVDYSSPKESAVGENCSDDGRPKFRDEMKEEEELLSLGLQESIGEDTSTAECLISNFFASWTEEYSDEEPTILDLTLQDSTQKREETKVGIDNGDSTNQMFPLTERSIPQEAGVQLREREQELETATEEMEAKDWTSGDQNCNRDKSGCNFGDQEFPLNYSVAAAEKESEQSCSAANREATAECEQPQLCCSPTIEQIRLHPNAFRDFQIPTGEGPERKYSETAAETDELEFRSRYRAGIECDYTPEEILAIIEVALIGTSLMPATKQTTDESEDQNAITISLGTNLSPEEFLACYDGGTAEIEAAAAENAAQLCADAIWEKSKDTADEPFKEDETKKTSKLAIQVDENIICNEQSSVTSSEGSLLGFKKKSETGLAPAAEAVKGIISKKKPKNAKTVTFADQISEIDLTVDYRSNVNTANTSQSTRKEATVDLVPAIKAEKPTKSKKRPQTGKTEPLKGTRQKTAKGKFADQICKIKTNGDHRSIANTANTSQSTREEVTVSLVPAIKAEKSTISHKRPQTAKTVPAKGIRQKTTGGKFADQISEIDLTVHDRSNVDTANTSQSTRKEATVDLVPAVKVEKSTISRKRPQTAKTKPAKRVKQEAAEGTFVDQIFEINPNVDEATKVDLLLAGNAGKPMKDLKKKPQTAKTVPDKGTKQKTAGGEIVDHVCEINVNADHRSILNTANSSQSAREEAPVDSVPAVKAKKPTISRKRPQTAESLPAKRVKQETGEKFKSAKRTASTNRAENSNIVANKIIKRETTENVGNHPTQNKGNQDSPQKNFSISDVYSYTSESEEVTSLSQFRARKTRGTGKKIIETEAVAMRCAKQDMEEDGQAVETSKNEDDASEEYLAEVPRVLVDAGITFPPYPTDMDNRTILVYEPDARQFVWDSLELKNSPPKSLEKLSNVAENLRFLDNGNSQGFSGTDNTSISSRIDGTSSVESAADSDDELILRDSSSGRRSTRRKSLIERFVP